MFPSAFTYHRPSSVAEAVQLIANDPDAKILAGGHSLIPAMKLRLAMPGTLVDLSRIPDLRHVDVTDDCVTIGAMTTYNDLQDDARLAAVLPVIGEAVREIGDPQVRSRGTIGGALAHADPAADLTTVVLALDGRMTAQGPDGQREIPADDFFVDIFTTALQPDEVLTNVAIPVVRNRGSAYKKIEHPASGYAVVGVAASLTVENGTCTEARIALTGCTSKPTRASAAEQALVGKPLDAETINAAAQAIPEGVELTGDAFASAAYRGHLATVVGAEVITKAAERAR